MVGNGGQYKSMNTWFQRHADDVLHAQKVTLDKGLSDAEAAVRLKHYGQNQLQGGKKVNPLMLFLGQFKDVLIIILMVAAVVSWGVGQIGSGSDVVVPEYCQEPTSAIYDADCSAY